MEQIELKKEELEKIKGGNSFYTPLEHSEESAIRAPCTFGCSPGCKSGCQPGCSGGYATVGVTI